MEYYLLTLSAVFHTWGKVPLALWFFAETNNWCYPFSPIGRIKSYLIGIFMQVCSDTLPFSEEISLCKCLISFPLDRKDCVSLNALMECSKRLFVTSLSGRETTVIRRVLRINVETISIFMTFYQLTWMDVCMMRFPSRSL